MSVKRGLTRQEALWWVAPTLRHWRERLLEGKDVLGRSLPVLLYANNLGWYVRGSYSLTSNHKSFFMSGTSSVGLEEKGPWPLLKGSRVVEALDQPKPPVLDNLGSNADAERFWRFINTAYDKFTAPEPEVASLWREDGKVMCGWDPLSPEDGRLPCKKVPGNLPITWFGDVEWIHLDEWTWRVERTDLRYDGIYANDHPDWKYQRCRVPK